MSYPASLSKTATQLSLWTMAIAASLLTVSLPIAAASTELPSPLVTARSSDSAEVNPAAVLALALGGSAAIGLGLSAVVDRQRRLQPANQPLVPADTARLDRVSRPLRQKLIRSLHDDQKAAERLFAQAYFRYPGKTPDWYAEKVIYDLERDRGRY